jgi:arsenate reductase
MLERGVDISGQRSKSLAELQGQEFDLEVTVCNRAEEACPFFPGGGERVHQSFPDPAAAAGTDEERLCAFRGVRDAIEAWIEESLKIEGKSIRKTVRVGDKVGGVQGPPEGFRR